MIRGGVLRGWRCSWWRSGWCGGRSLRRALLMLCAVLPLRVLAVTWEELTPAQRTVL